MAEISEALLIAELEKRLTSKYSQIPAEAVSTAVQNARTIQRQSDQRFRPTAGRTSSTH